MVRYEKYGENLIDDFFNKLNETDKFIKNKFGNNIEIIQTRHSYGIGLSSNMGNYSIEVNWWNILKDKEIIASVETMADVLGCYYQIDVD